MQFENEFVKYGVKHMGIGSNKLNDFKNYTTPYILEERQMQVTQMDVFSRLMADRIIFVTGTVEQNMCDIIQAQLLFLDNVDSGKDITFYCNTGGGSVIAGLGIVDTMNYVKPDIATVNVGLCASMGSILLGAGTKGKRTALPFSKVMIHQVSSGTQGHVEDNRINQMESEKYNYILFKMLSEFTDKDFKEILEIANRDKWCNSEETLELGLVDEILYPAGGGVKPISSYMEGFDEYYSEIISKL